MVPSLLDYMPPSTCDSTLPLWSHLHMNSAGPFMGYMLLIVYDWPCNYSDKLLLKPVY